MKIGQIVNILMIGAFLFSTILFAEEDTKKETKTKEDSTTKTEIKELVISGVLLKEEGKGEGEKSYFIQTQKGKVYLPNKIGDKEIDLEKFKDKHIVAKGKGERKLIAKEDIPIKSKWGKNPTIPIFQQLISIELKDLKDESDTPIKEDLGNVSGN